MSKRLQVLMTEDEYAKLKQVAKSKHVAVGEWVRRVIGTAILEEDVKPAASKLAAIRSALLLSHPAPSIEQMNREIAEGYL